MTQIERVLGYLWSIGPKGATNAEIALGTGITPHQAVYMATQNLLHQGRVRSEREGRTWVFYAQEGPAVDLGHSPVAATSPVSYARAALSAARFEEMARAKLGQLFESPLPSGSLPGVPKRFDFVSPDRGIVGDAKFYTLVGGTGLPPAKFSIIAEHVWLLEKTSAPIQFLVFGNDRSVPVLWLKRYGHLAEDVAFYFLSDSGDLGKLR